MQIAKLIGGAGTGKTSELLAIMERALAAGDVDIMLIGFVSFTRAARREAAQRAAAQDGSVSAAILETEGWFRTLHSICFRCLGLSRGDVLATDTTDGRNWLRDNVGVEPPKVDGEQSRPNRTVESVALAIWGHARNQLRSIEDTLKGWRGWPKPSLEQCTKVIERYERAKRLEGIMDFADLLAIYAGIYCSPGGYDKITPDGDVPQLPIWIHDEMQDSSALLHAAFERLTSGSQWVYYGGDPYQAIYGFGGSDPSIFMDAHADKTRVMPKSHRCAAPILAFGESILRRCSDYWDRGIAPADHDGGVHRCRWMPSVLSGIDPTTDTLIVARTHQHLARIRRALRNARLPWRETHSKGSWCKPTRLAAMHALYAIEHDEPIHTDDLRRLIDQVPATKDGVRYIEHGKKKVWKAAGARLSKTHKTTNVPALPSLGLTSALIQDCRLGRWVRLFEEAPVYRDIRKKHGADVVRNPSIRIGTIHSVKGAEADSVYYLTSTSRIIEDTRDDEERRVEYVAATRARHHLHIMEEPVQFRARV